MGAIPQALCEWKREEINEVEVIIVLAILGT